VCIGSSGPSYRPFPFNPASLKGAGGGRPGGFGDLTDFCPVFKLSVTPFIEDPVDDGPTDRLGGFINGAGLTVGDARFGAGVGTSSFDPSPNLGRFDGGGCSTCTPVNSRSGPDNDIGVYIGPSCPSYDHFSCNPASHMGAGGGRLGGFGELTDF
jgi:hypothetical protein